MPGPRPTPSAILRLRGSRRIENRGNEPEPEVGTPDMPTQLSGEGQQVWRQYVPMLEATPGLLRKVDGLLLGALCEQHANYWKVQTVLNRLGVAEPVVDDAGNPIGLVLRKDFVRATVNLSAEVRKLAAEFGIGPAARAKIQIQPEHVNLAESKARFFRGGA